MFFDLFGGGSKRPSRREVRTFRPALGDAGTPLESRLVLSAAGTVSAAVVSAASSASAVSAWNNAAAWKFIEGGWSSTVSMPLVKQLVAAFGGKHVPVPKGRSLDAWTVGDSSVVMTPGAGLKAMDSTIGGLGVKFNPSGAPDLSLDSTDGSPPTILHAAVATRRSITFRGQATMTMTENGKDTAQSVPVYLTLTRVSPKTFRFDLGLADSRQAPFLSYSARRPIR